MPYCCDWVILVSNFSCSYLLQPFHWEKNWYHTSRENQCGFVGTARLTCFGHMSNQKELACCQKDPKKMYLKGGPKRSPQKKDKSVCPKQSSHWSNTSIESIASGSYAFKYTNRTSSPDKSISDGKWHPIHFFGFGILLFQHFHKSGASRSLPGSLSFCNINTMALWLWMAFLYLSRRIALSKIVEKAMCNLTLRTLGCSQLIVSERAFRGFVPVEKRRLVGLYVESACYYACWWSATIENGRQAVDERKKCSQNNGL
jgi:hypothetical protein